MKLRLTTLIIILAVVITGLLLSYQGETLQNQANNGPIVVLRGDPGVRKQIKVDLSLQKAFLFENGEFLREFNVSSGKIDTPTPKGTFSVVYKQDMLYSKIAGCWLAFWVGFTQDGKYGFHETPVCDGIREGENEIGQPASAGCLRLKLGEAEQLYNWAEVGTKVEIY